jgi:hypothetical protein
VSVSARYEEHTVLELGARGALRGAPFVLAGRVAVRSASGGVWTEWTLAFDDGRHAFLAEAPGAFTLYVERPLPSAYEELPAPGQPLATSFVVVERGRARRVSGWGDASISPRTYRYADLSSTSGEAATLDYGAAEAQIFVGSRVRLRALGLAPRARRRRFLPAPGGPVPPGVELWLEPGDEGALPVGRGAARATFRVIGAVHRSIEVDGDRYTWEEYVLHAAEEGLRWLVVADGHVSLAASVEPGTVAFGERGARLGGDTFRPLSQGTARVDWATGELPWAVAVGDETRARDYVRAPHLLSCEETDDEISWSLGAYTPAEVVARAFRKPAFPRPRGRAPHQPRASRAPKRR